VVFRIDPRAGRAPLAIAIVSAGLLVPAIAQAEEATSLIDIFGLSGEEQQPRVELAQSAEEAQMLVRMQQLEEHIRLLTGQVEGLQFQLTQLQTLLENQTQAIEARFNQIEGGAPVENQGAVEPEVAPSTDVAAATPDLTVPEEGAQPLPGELEIDPTFDQPMDDVGLSQDPLVGTGEGEQPAELGSLPADQPLDLTLEGVAAPPNGDAVAQFNAAYEAIVRGDYAFAEEQFAQFIALYPDDPQAADATSWWGETLLQRGAYTDAMEVLFNGYKKYPDSPRAPDLMLKLGIALIGAEERDTACRTFAEIPKRYTGLSADFTDRLNQEMGKAQCPPAG
jgi:tol-pal system protein YbgF